MNANQPHRTKPADRACLPAWRWATVLILVLVARTSEGIDLGQWARNMLHHDDWTSLDFRDPFLGMFLAARAGTDDPRTKATLTFTAALRQQCVLDVSIAINVGQPAVIGSEQLSRATVQFDGTTPRYLSVRIVSPRDDSFVFVEFLEKISPDLVRNYQTMVVAIPDREPSVFSLKGFDSAWDTAQATCRSFMLPDTK